MSGEVCVLSLSACLIYQICVLVWFVASSFFLWIANRQGPWSNLYITFLDKHSDTLTGSPSISVIDQLWFLSLPSLSFVHQLCVLLSSCLWLPHFPIIPWHWKGSWPDTLKASDTLLPCTHRSILWKGIPEILPSPGWLMLLTQPISPHFLCGKNYCFLYTSGDYKWNCANGKSIIFFFFFLFSSEHSTTENIAQKQKNNQYIWRFPGYRT